MLLRSIRHSVRLFRYQPGLAASAVLALAMGIGFTTTMFGIVHGATRSLPVNHPEQVVIIDKIPTRAGGDGVSRVTDLQLWRRASSFERVAAFEMFSVNLSDAADAPERASAAAITADVFSITGAVPQSGRVLVEADSAPGAPAVVVISDALWRRRYGAAAVLGASIRIDGRAHAIVGVMPPRFAFPVNQALWLPLPADPTSALRIVGRLKPAISSAAARDEILSLASASSPAGSAPTFSVNVYPFVEMETPREVVRALYLMVIAVSFVLVIACSNVANLLLARAAARSRDAAVLLALGAERRHLIAASLGESLALATAGSVLGLAMAWVGTRLFAVNTAHIIEAYWVDIRVDPLVALFAAALALVSAVAAGLGPALRASHTDVTAALAGSGRTTLRLGRVGRSLLAVQVMLACGLLALTMVLARSAVPLRSLDWPFDPTTMLSAQLGDIATDGPARRVDVLRALLREIQNAPGVTAAALTSALPGRGGGSWTFGLDAPVAAGARSATTSIAAVTPEFFDVVGAAVLTGRLLQPGDDAVAPGAAVVNTSFVRRHSPDRSPLGRRVFVGTRSFSIVGVVPDLMANDLQDRDQAGVYVPLQQMQPLSMRLIARGPADPITLAAPIRAAVARVDADLPITEFFTVHEAAYREKRVLDVLSLLFLTFGAGALTLTGIGLYGMLSLAVASRRREISIRLALGSTRWRVVSLVARQATWQIAIGLTLGCALAIGLSYAFAAAVEQIAPASWPLLLGIVGSLAATSAVAIVVPARRASRGEIVAGLRAD